MAFALTYYFVGVLAGLHREPDFNRICEGDFVEVFL